MRFCISIQSIALAENREARPLKRMAKRQVVNAPYSHSIVAGGLPEIS